MKSQRVRKLEQGSDGGAQADKAVGRYDVERERRRAMGVAEKVAKLEASGRGAQAQDALKRGERRLKGALAMEVANAEKLGASVPEVRALLKTSWRVIQVDVPQGEEFVEAQPAYVIQFDGNSPIERLKKAGMLGDGQVRAAAKFTGLWLQAVKPPRVTGSYDAVIAAGGAAPRPWVDVFSDAWAKLSKAMGTMLPVESEIVQEVAVFETPIETIARRRDLVRFADVNRAKGAATTLLSCGLMRLSYHWGLEAGQPRDVAK
jgi:hypothetical protein